MEKLPLAFAWISLFAALACQTGGGAPDIARTPQTRLFSTRLPRSGGGIVDFSEFRGRVLLVDFFSTWMNASLVSIPAYAALHEKYHDHGLVVTGVSLDEYGDQVLVPFVAALKIPYPVALADAAVRDGRSVFGDLIALPELMIFDRAGRLVKVFLGTVVYDELEELLQRLLP